MTWRTLTCFSKLKGRLATIIRNSFLHKNGNRRYKYLVLGREGPYFVKEHSEAKNKYTEEDIIKMLEFLVDNIFVVFAGKVFQQIVGIPMGKNCAPLLADIFLYSYEAEFIQSLLSAGKKRLASQFNFRYRYIDDVLSINNPDFENYLGQMYPPELEIKDTTESNTSASYLDVLLSIGRDGQLRTSLYDKRDDFNFHITNFPFLSSNIPSSPAYGVFISQLIRYARACSSYECFILRAMRLSNKLLGQGYAKERSWHQNFDIIMDACEAYARKWAKKEDVELDTLSEWIKSIGEVVKRRIRRLKHSVNTRSVSIFRDPDVVRELSRLHENFVIVPADKASNNYTFVCKRHYVDILIEELGLHSLPENPTYNLTDFSASEVLDNHKSVLTSFGVQSNSEELDLPYIYWIPKMHNNPYKHRFIAGSSKCSTKPLSILLTKLLTHIKQGLQKYCETAYSRSGVNQMWILKNSKELLDHLKSPNFNLITNIKSFDFSTLYTTISHQKLKSRLATIIRNSFLHKNGNRRYKYLVLGREGPYFVKEHSDAKNKYTEEDIIKMLEFLVDNIFVVFAGKVFQQIVGIPMGTNCAPLLADIFLYSYEAEFIQSLLSAGKKRLASQFNFTYRYIDDVLSINNPDFENYLGQMYPPELEIKDTTESNTSASYLDLLLSIGRDGQLRTSLYDKRDDFNFHITNFPFLSSNIPSSPAYGVFISQLIRYARACSSYECFILRAMRLSNKLLGQGYVKERLKSSLRKFYGRYGDLTKQYEVPLSRMLHDILDDDQIQWHPPLIGHYTNFWPLLIWTLLPNLTFYLLYKVSMEHMQRVRHANRGRLLLRTPGPVPFGTCICSTCWD